jgi:hypothetical protein
LKAFCLASALIASIVPAHAGELSTSTRSVRVGEPQISRMYRVHWVRSYERTGGRVAQISTNESASAAGILAGGSAADDKAFQAKVRAAVAYARDIARQAEADGIKGVKTRVRVRCMSKHVVERSGPTLVAFAASMPGSRPSGEKVAHTSTEVCSVKIVQRRPTRQAPAMRAFNVGLPPIDQAGP